MTEVSQHVRILGVSERAALLPEVMHACRCMLACVADVGAVQWHASRRRCTPGGSCAPGRRFRPRM
ncbi:hypothetical protein XbrCFBP1976_13025 [Xanthomonas bromi]|uniref:Uncharacterized protein n=1 Tax=Xanthomonas bromi TaxID=56449 RepID=A0ABX5BNI1_9XANT|nr:hypothetical protein XbrCFBP1976_13025 [Xanthomonas bromi]